jgi:hypothetical protein
MKRILKINYLLSFLLINSFLTYGQDFYDLDEVQNINVHLSQNDWDQLMDDNYAATGDYLMADSVTINGQVFDSVGVKFKGNSTYRANQDKNPWHIELDTYKDQDYQGYKDIKLANVYKDPSFLRDALAYQIVRQYMEAPEANYTNLYVNGSLIGLYTNTESISKTFVKDRFGSKSNTFFKCSPPDGASPQGSDFPNLVYLGQDSSDYYEAYELKSDNGWQDLIDLTDVLKNNTSDIENILDVDRAIWMLAFDNAIVNLDSYIGQFSQNYYLYKDDFGRFLPVIWDLNESFGTFSSTGSGNLNSTNNKQEMDHLLHLNDSDFPLTSELLSIDTYKKMYLAHLKTIMEENFTNNGNYYTMAQAISSTISGDVQADPNKFYTYNQFQSNLTSDVTSGGPGPGSGSIPGITNLMNDRYDYLMNLNEFSTTDPTISQVEVSNLSPTIGNTITVNATVTDQNQVFLRYRSHEGAPFDKVEMFDDGNHNDGAAGDNIFGAEMQISSTITQYYIYAENNTIGKFSPARAQHEFYSFTITGGIPPGDIVINEFMASNDQTVADQDGEFNDWIELYNNSNSAIDISGYGISDKNDELNLFTIPNGTTLQANDYLIIWADKDLDQDGFHADFKISSGGETLYLTNSNQEIIDSVAFSSQSTDIAFGRFPNGTGSFQALTPTFDGENNISPSLSNDEELTKFDLTISPNPASDYIQIDYSGSDLDLNSEIVIYNAMGQVFKKVNIMKNNTAYIDDLSNGIYFVKLENSVKKFIVRK